jgi:hypothetical protein
MKSHRLPPEVDPLAKTVRLELDGLGRALEKAVRLEWIRFRTKAVDAFLGGVFVAVALGFCLGAVAAAAWFLANALRDAVGNLAAGAVILALMICAGLAVRARFRRRGVREAREVSEDES